MAARTKRGKPAGTRGKRQAGPRALEAARPKDRKDAGRRFSGALEAVARFLEASGRPAAVIGGMAVIAHGFARATLDIDASVAVGPDEIPWLLEIAAKQGLFARVKDAEAFARDNLVVLLEHRASGVPVDVSLALQPFEVEALGAAIEADVAGVHVRVPRLADLVIYKVLAGRPQDLRDVEFLLAEGKDIDSARIERQLAEFDSILETDRVGEFRMLLRKRGRS